MHPYDNAEALLRALNAPRRNKFFYGKRMDVQHFQMEQDYGKLKQWLLNRLTLGKGVMCGLHVRVDSNLLCVDPGVAIDGLGREIVVPVRACIDAAVRTEDCCGGTSASATPAGDGIYTLWLCYRECLTDRQPTMVSECGTREECAAGTTVETFCLKLLPGLAPLQGDPAWCTKPQDPAHGGIVRPPVLAADMTSRLLNLRTADSPANVSKSKSPLAGLTDADRAALAEAAGSLRHAVCRRFDGDCAPADEDPCVPLALVGINEGVIEVEECLVRPRIYSNQDLLDLILCLARKVEDCCNAQDPGELLRVRSIDFLRRDDKGGESVVASVQSPLQVTKLGIEGKTNAIRIRFNRPLAQGAHAPNTAGYGDADYLKHNVVVLPDPVPKINPYVPGKLQLEAPDTVRFDLLNDSIYSSGVNGWREGRFRILLCGSDDAASQRLALTDAVGRPLDGEPISPAGGVISGDGTAGGDFGTIFEVVGTVPRQTLRVTGVDFVDSSGELLASVKSPLEDTLAIGDIKSIRIRLNQPYQQSGPSAPTTHGLDDSDYAKHNVQVLIADPAQAKQLGIEYVPGKLVMESDTVLRFDVIFGSKVVNEKGYWNLGDTQGACKCKLVLRGTPPAGGQQAEIVDGSGQALDGEPIVPAGGYLSGDNAPGGDFVAPFTVTSIG